MGLSLGGSGLCVGGQGLNVGVSGFKSWLCRASKLRLSMLSLFCHTSGVAGSALGPVGLV